MNVFEAVKQSVTTRQAASYYGIRVGRNGMACCPFHNDRTPSMKVDSRYYCFGCGASGDVIDFAASLHGLGKRDAAVRLAEDFSIPYDGAIRTPAAKRTPPKPTPEQRLRQAEQHCFKVLCDYLHLLERWKIEYAPQPQDAAWHPLFVEALQKNSYVEYLLDILLFGEMEEKAALIAEQGKEAAQEAVMRTMDAMEPAQTQEEIREMLEGTQKGGVKNSIKNCLTVFQRDPLLRGAVSYNILSERVDIVKPL